jgi:hypothetical protein
MLSCKSCKFLPVKIIQEMSYFKSFFPLISSSFLLAWVRVGRLRVFFSLFSIVLQHSHGKGMPGTLFSSCYKLAQVFSNIYARYTVARHTFGVQCYVFLNIFAEKNMKKLAILVTLLQKNLSLHLFFFKNANLFVKIDENRRKNDYNIGS